MPVHVFVPLVEESKPSPKPRVWAMRLRLTGIGTAIIAQAGIWIRQGTNIHAVLNSTSISALAAGLIIIEYNKSAHGAPHFTSPHGILGLITYILFFIQAFVGITQYYTPALYGGLDNAKKIWKYHRMSGYLVLIMGLVTVCAATQTDFNKMT
ncbi:MAG: hypothetical protein Q9217_002190 [Psora testacea]